jgi:hypothetical protein
LPTCRLSIDRIRDAKIHQAFDYWQSIKQGKRVPARGDLDPVDIPRLLPYIYLTEIHRDPLRIRYRLVGTKVCEMAGRDLTGRWMHEETWLHDYEKWLDDYRTVMASRQPLFGHDDLDFTDGARIGFEWALFPLGRDGETVDMAFELEIADDERALLREPLSERPAPRLSDEAQPPERDIRAARDARGAESTSRRGNG